MKAEEASACFAGQRNDPLFRVLQLLACLDGIVQKVPEKRVEVAFVHEREPLPVEKGSETDVFVAAKNLLFRKHEIDRLVSCFED